MTPFVIPQPISYQDPIRIFPSNLRNRPLEGDRVIPLAIDWSAAGANNSVRFNLTAQGTLPFSQIAALFVDNVQNDFDVTFVFPDTNFVIRIPAATAGLYPVTTNGFDFYAISTGASAGTFTRIQVFNYYPYPVAVAKPEFVAPAVTPAQILIAAGSTVLIAAPTDGIITAAQIQVIGITGGAAAGQAVFQLKDGNNKIIAACSFYQAAGAFTASAIILDLSGVVIPYTNGLNLVITFSGTAFVGGGVFVNLYAR